MFGRNEDACSQAYQGIRHGKVSIQAIVNNREVSRGFGIMGSSSQSVVLISDKTSGGAAIACSRLLRGLRSVSKREFLWLAGEGTARAEVKCLSEWRGAMEIFVERLITRAFSGNKQSMDRLNRRLAVYCNERRMAKTIRKMSPGLINLHNIHDAMRFSMVETLPRDTSIVWTLHDMWPLTGYCCYSFDCRKYREGCRGECPQLNKWGDLFSTPSEEWSRRQRFYQQNRNRIVFVTPSQWLAGCARNRFDGTIRVECIPNSLDTNVFKPVGSKKEMREALELPTDKRIVLAGSRYPNDPRKGTEYLVEATERLRESLGDSFAVVVFGEYSAEDLPNDWIRSRSISDEKTSKPVLQRG